MELVESVELVEFRLFELLVLLALGLEGDWVLEHFLPDLPFLSYVKFNLSLNYNSSIIILFYNSYVTLLPCFYFISYPHFAFPFFCFSHVYLFSFLSINSLLSVIIDFTIIYFYLFLFLLFKLKFNSYLIPDMINNFRNLSYLNFQLIPDRFECINDQGILLCFSFPLISEEEVKFTNAQGSLLF